MKMLEIERKFLVSNMDFKDEAFSETRITQGYLSSEPARTVRIRIYGNKGFLTIKGSPDTSGTTRFEWEKEIPLSDAETLLKLCEPGIVDKTRYLVKAGTKTFEVDVFVGENAGLIVAEIELDHKDADFEKPVWIGSEVTGDSRYYNSQLIKIPYSKW